MDQQTFDLDLIPNGGKVIESRMNGQMPQTVFTYNVVPDDPGCKDVAVSGGTCYSTSVFGNDLVRRLVNCIYSSDLTDILSGYRAFNRRVVEFFDRNLKKAPG